jgi:hypothetical protein
MHIWKLTSRFIGSQIPNFEGSLSLSPGPQSNLVLPYNFLFEALNKDLWHRMIMYQNIKVLALDDSQALYNFSMFSSNAIKLNSLN